MTADLPGEVRQVANGDATIAYSVAGPSGDTTLTLCLLASTGRGPEDFAGLAHHLVAHGLRVVCPWPRSMGGSTGDLSKVDFHDLAADAAAALRAERGTGGGVIVGHAYGCWIARTVAQNHPDLVDAIILLAAGGNKWDPALSKGIEVAMDPGAPTADRLAALRLGFFTDDHDPSPWLNGWSGTLVDAQRAARTRTDRDSWWPSGTAPILDLIGLQDPFRPAEGRDFYVKEFAPRVDQITVDGASHALPDEKPEEVAAHMAAWLDKISPKKDQEEGLQA